MDQLLLKTAAARFFATLILLLAGAAQAAPLLRCAVTYAGATQQVEARPVADPYTVASVDVGERFRFKAVLIGSDSGVERIALYAYRETSEQNTIIQEAKYFPPFARQLTGEQHLYAGPLERELIYRCELEDTP